MALINCPECNREVSDKASSCPHCGYPIALKNDLNLNVLNVKPKSKHKKKKSKIAFDFSKLLKKIEEFFKTVQYSKKSQMILGGALAGVALVITLCCIIFDKPNQEIIADDESSQVVATTAVPQSYTYTNTYSSVATSSPVTLREAYYDCDCISTYCDLAYDGSYLIIDTNPSDVKGLDSDKAVKMISAVNKKLGFSNAVLAKMAETRAIDGMQSDSNDYFEVSWSYNPEKGLVVIYSTK